MNHTGLLWLSNCAITGRQGYNCYIDFTTNVQGFWQLPRVRESCCMLWEKSQKSIKAMWVSKWSAVVQAFVAMSLWWVHQIHTDRRACISHMWKCDFSHCWLCVRDVSEFTGSTTSVRGDTTSNCGRRSLTASTVYQSVRTSLWICIMYERSRLAIDWVRLNVPPNTV